MIFDVFIKNNQTGEIRLYSDEYEDNDIISFLWSDGNYACDCNRSLFFARAKGEPDPEITKCTDYKFSVLYIINRETKQVIYYEDI